MDFSVKYLADKLAAHSLPELSSSANAHEIERHTILLNRKSYDTQALVLNAAVAVLVGSVALAAIGLFSMQAALILGAIGLFTRNGVNKNLVSYCTVPDEALAAIGREAAGGNLREDEYIQIGRNVLSAKAKKIGETKFDDGDAVLFNLGYKWEKHKDWEPARYRVFGHRVWMNSLPTADESNEAVEESRVDRLAVLARSLISSVRA